MRNRPLRKREVKRILRLAAQSAAYRVLEALAVSDDDMPYVEEMRLAIRKIHKQALQPVARAEGWAPKRSRRVMSAALAAELSANDVLIRTDPNRVAMGEDPQEPII